MGLGLREAGWEVAGIDHDPKALAVYREAVAAAWWGDAADAHSPWPSGCDLVWGDVPRPRGPFRTREFARERGSFAWQTLRLALEARASAVVLSYPGADGMLTKIGEFAMEAGFWCTGQILDVADFGVPQHRRVAVVVGFARKRAWSTFRWPHPTHTSPERAHDAKKLPWRTVRETIGLPFDEPSPRISVKEQHSGWRGMRGGRMVGKGWNASEVIANHIGRAEWGSKPVALPPKCVLVLQGMPAWEIAMPACDVYRLAGRAFPPPVSRAIGARILRAIR